MEWTPLKKKKTKRERLNFTSTEEIQTILKEREIEDLWMDKQQWKMGIQSIL